MEWKNVIYHRIRSSNGKSVWLYWSTESEIWVLDGEPPGSESSNYALQLLWDHLRLLANAIAKNLYTNEAQTFTLNFGNRKNSTKVAKARIANNLGIGLSFDDADKTWLLDVLYELLRKHEFGS